MAELLENSKEYREYCAAREDLMKKSETAQTLLELRSQQMNLYLAQVIGEDVDEELDEFQSIYFDFSADPLVSKFLYAEGRFTKLYGDIQKTLGKKLDILSDFEVKIPNDNIFLN